MVRNGEKEDDIVVLTTFEEVAYAWLTFTQTKLDKKCDSPFVLKVCFHCVNVYERGSIYYCKMLYSLGGSKNELVVASTVY